MVNPVKLVLALGIAATLAWGAVEIRRDNTLIPASGSPEADARPTQIELPEEHVPALEEFAETLQRPLFFADRRLPETEIKEVQETVNTPQQDKAPELRLSAIVIEQDRAVALAEGADGKSLRLREGESISGWEVLRIEERAIVLHNRGQEQRIELLKFGEAQPARPPPPLKRQQRARPRAGRRIPPPPLTTRGRPAPGIQRAPEE